MDSKETNPKDAIGGTKLPLDLVPGSVEAYAALAFLEGALKYGKFNWRISGVKASVYIAAIKRHLKKFENGQDVDPKTLVHHLGSIMACCGIILDAMHVGKLVDDRAPRHPTDEVIDGMVPVIAHLKQMFAGCNPHQFTIEDSQWAPESDRKSTTRSTTGPTRPRSSARLATKRGAKPRKKAKSGRATARKSITKSRSRKAARTRSRTGG